jgi:hypothetical protein
MFGAADDEVRFREREGVLDAGVEVRLRRPDPTGSSRAPKWTLGSPFVVVCIQSWGLP